MTKDAYEVLIADLIEHATPLQSSLHLCHQQFIPDTQVVISCHSYSLLAAREWFWFLKNFSLFCTLVVFHVPCCYLIRLWCVCVEYDLRYLHSYVSFRGLPSVAGDSKGKFVIIAWVQSWICMSISVLMLIMQLLNVEFQYCCHVTSVAFCICVVKSEM